MDLINYLEKSLKSAIEQSGNMRKFSEQVGMDYSTINRFNSGVNAIENMPLKTMIRLFPDLKIYCLKSDYPTEVISSEPSIGDDIILDQLSILVKDLQPREKIRLLTFVAANFGCKIKEDTK